MRTVYAFVRNGAVIKSWDRPEPAIEQAAQWAAFARPESFQGFDVQGRTAVVERQPVFQVEQLVDDRPAGSREAVSWRLDGLLARWVGRERQAVAA